MAETIHHKASGLNLQFISAEENEFLAKEQCIIITSGVSHDRFEFISGNFGPLEAGLPCKVPLWFALQLRRNGKCIIEIPEWLQLNNLKSVIEETKASQSFEEIPYFYVEITQLLLTYAKNDFESPEETRSLVEDLFNIRMDFMRFQLLTLRSQRITPRTYINVRNVGAAELLCIKGFLPQMLDSLMNLGVPADGTRGGASSGTAYGMGMGGAAARSTSGGGGGDSTAAMQRGERRPLRRLRQTDA